MHGSDARQTAARRPRVSPAMAIQIYSMTSVPDAVATAEAGADLIGLVIAEPGVVAEAIGADLARKILSAARSRGVALSLSDDRDEICAMVDAVRPDVLHVVAREIEPEDCAWIRERIAPVMLLCAIAVRAGETLTEADAHQECLDYLMLDSGAKGPPYAGATGETHDWSVSRTVVERSRIPVILAGGLSAENVADAIATVRPWGVDSFTHTDIPGQRGKKDPARVRAFVAAAKRGFAQT
jgi:phosphoribosylanthranilate isomerase